MDRAPGLGNVAYWRTNKWLIGWFGRPYPTEEEDRLGLNRYEIGSLRFNAFWSRLKDPEHGTCPPWTLDDLPFMFQEMKKSVGKDQEKKKPLPPPYRNDLPFGGPKVPPQG